MQGTDRGAAAEPHTAMRIAETSSLEAIVSELRDIERRTGIERTLAIGGLVLDRFFGGDPKVWRDRRRNKNNSIRRLAQRKDCPFSKSALHEAVAVYVASLALPCVRTFGHITASHVASVLKLEQDERESMLERAERERWTVRELRSNVVERRRSDGERRGRPRAGPESQALAQLARATRLAKEATLRLEKAYALLSDTQNAIARAVDELRELEGRLTVLSRAGS
jgi:hypothetical protein